MSNLISFSFNTLPVRTIKDDDQVWFVAKDIATALEYSKDSNASRLFTSVPDEWKGVKPFHTLGGEQQILCINEPGLYFFLGRSDKPKALPFQKWVASEVIPSIRKTGEYKMNQGNGASEEEAFAEYKKVDLEKVGSALKSLLKETVPTGSKRLELANNFMAKCLNLDLLDIAQYKPIVDNTVIDDIPRYTPTKLGKPYGLSPQKINKLLEQAGLQCKEGSGWVPTEEGKLQGGVLLGLDGHLTASSNISQLKWPITVINLIINNSEH